MISANDDVNFSSRKKATLVKYFSIVNSETNSVGLNKCFLINQC